MKELHSYTIRLAGGRLFSLDSPQVMGILNVTPDSFYAGSRQQSEEEIGKRVRQIANEGASMLDIGAYSSRPGADDVPIEEEMARLRRGLTIVKREAPDLVVSVDTFRADVARMCIEEFGIDIINDISGGLLDRNMFRTVAKTGVPYILMHMQGTPQTMQQAPHYEDFLKEVFLYLAEKVARLHDLGVKDIIIDPGFGFGKDPIDGNYALMNVMEQLHVLELPILVGISRKRMIHQLLGITAQESLNGTTALNMIALMKGASILRVHDVKEAVETVRIYGRLAAAARTE